MKSKVIIDTTRANLARTLEQLKKYLLGGLRSEPSVPYPVTPSPVFFKNEGDTPVYVRFDPTRATGEELPALKPLMQRMHPKLSEITNFAASIGAHISNTGRRGLKALQFERLVLEAIQAALLAEQDPSNAPLMEVVQQYQARVERVIDDVLNPGRQEDLLEQPNDRPAVADATPDSQSAKAGTSLREGRAEGDSVLEFRDKITARVDAGFCGYCDNSSAEIDRKRSNFFCAACCDTMDSYRAGGITAGGV